MRQCLSLKNAFNYVPAGVEDKERLGLSLSYKTYTLIPPMINDVDSYDKKKKKKRIKESLVLPAPGFRNNCSTLNTKF